MKSSFIRNFKRLSREPPRETEATASALLFFVVVLPALQEVAGKVSQVLAVEDAQDDEDDVEDDVDDEVSLPVSETIVGDPTGSDDVEIGAEPIVEDKEEAVRFLPRSSLVVSEAAFSSPSLFAATRLELPPAVAAALATNSSRYIVCRFTLLSTWGPAPLLARREAT